MKRAQVLNLAVSMIRRSQVRMYRTTSNEPSSLSQSDVGKLYQVPNVDVDRLGLNKTLPSPLRKQYDTLGELLLVVRSSLLEVFSCMEAVRPSFPNIRTVLWGAFGTGKSSILNQVVHSASSKNWVVIHLYSAMDLTRRVTEIEMSSYKQGHINDPNNAVKILSHFKLQNQAIWKTLSELKTGKQYDWNKNEKTAIDRPITDIVEMGLSAPSLATDCVGALFKELKRHSSTGSITTLVAIDDANSLWGKTLVKRADRSFAQPADLTLVRHFRSLISKNWTNGLVLLVADSKEVKDARDHLTVPRHTPLELFGEEGFDHIEPFIPIETTQYSNTEVENIYNYYHDKNWISSEAGRSQNGKLQMQHLSGFNPFYFERLAAFN